MQLVQVDPRALAKGCDCAFLVIRGVFTMNAFLPFGSAVPAWRYAGSSYAVE